MYTLAHALADALVHVPVHTPVCEFAHHKCNCTCLHSHRHTLYSCTQTLHTLEHTIWTNTQNMPCTYTHTSILCSYAHKSTGSSLYDLKLLSLISSPTTSWTQTIIFLLYPSPVWQMVNNSLRRFLNCYWMMSLSLLSTKTLWPRFVLYVIFSMLCICDIKIKPKITRVCSSGFLLTPAIILWEIEFYGRAWCNHCKLKWL